MTQVLETSFSLNVAGSSALQSLGLNFSLTELLRLNRTGISFFEPNIEIFSQRIFLNGSMRTFPGRVKAEWGPLFVIPGFTLA